MDDTELNVVAQKAAMAQLLREREPVTCSRCGGKPGEPGCGKIIHAIMDGYYETELRLLKLKEATDGHI